MKYEIPKLINFELASDVFCACLSNGTGASDSGCTNGEWVDLYCAPGGADPDCMDGGGASIISCALGGSTVHTRCWSGNDPH